MTKEQISEYAIGITYTDTKTKITLHNGDTFTGYFDHNPSPELANTNKWNFVEIPNFKQDKYITLNGDDFKKIEVIKL